MVCMSSDTNNASKTKTYVSAGVLKYTPLQLLIFWKTFRGPTLRKSGNSNNDHMFGFVALVMLNLN